MSELPAAAFLLVTGAAVVLFLGGAEPTPLGILVGFGKVAVTMAGMGIVWKICNTVRSHRGESDA